MLINEAFEIHLLLECVDKIGKLLAIYFIRFNILATEDLYHIFPILV